MKRIFLVTLLVLFFLSSVCFAATPGTCTQSSAKHGLYRVDVTMTCTAGDAGAFPATAFASAVMSYLYNEGFYLDYIEVNPGSVAPTADYTLTVVNANGRDIMGGAAADLSATVTQTIVPKKDSLVALYGGVYLDSSLTHTLADNSQAGAISVTKYFFVR